MKTIILLTETGKEKSKLRDGMIIDNTLDFNLDIERFGIFHNATHGWYELEVYEN